MRNRLAATMFSMANGTASSPAHPGPRESVPARHTRATELSCDGRLHHLGASEHLTQRHAADGNVLAGLCSLARSLARAVFLGASRRRTSAWYSLTHLICLGKVCPHQISRTANRTQRAPRSR